MKNLLFSSLFITAAFFSNAQAEIYVDHLVNAHYLGSVLPADFDTHDFSGEVIDLTPASLDEVIIDFRVENNTGSETNWIISRTRVNVDGSWNDFLCWGLQGGLCIDSLLMDQDVWVGPSSASFVTEVNDGEHALAFIHIDPYFGASGCGLYRYYIGSPGDPYQDSVDVNVCFSLGIDEQSAPALTVAPNPASDQITISGSTSGSLQLVNAVGQVVFEEEFTNETTIDVSALQPGIYFAILQSEGLKPVKEKIIIE